jgi:hypothetical protein
MPALLAVQRDVPITEPLKAGPGEAVVRTFRFLKTKNVRCVCGGKVFDLLHA